jgi:hypothetical protein
MSFHEVINQIRSVPLGPTWCVLYDEQIKAGRIPNPWQLKHMENPCFASQLIEGINDNLPCLERDLQDMVIR